MKNKELSTAEKIELILKKYRKIEFAYNCNNDLALILISGVWKAKVIIAKKGQTAEDLINTAYDWVVRR